MSLRFGYDVPRKNLAFAQRLHTHTVTIVFAHSFTLRKILRIQPREYTTVAENEKKKETIIIN